MNDEMKEKLYDFSAESSEMLEVLDQHFIKLKAEPTNTELLNEIFRCMRSMKGSAGFLGFTHLVELAHQAERLLNKLRRGEMNVSPFIIDIILEIVDAVKLLNTDIRETGEDTHVDTAVIVNKLTLTMDSVDPSEAETISTGVVAQETSGNLLEQLEEREVPADPTLTTDASATESDSMPDSSEVLAKRQEGPSRSFRVASHNSTKASGKKEKSNDRVEKKQADHVRSLVGELVLGRNRLMKIRCGLEEQYKANPLVRELGVTLAQLNLVTSDLQVAVMNTRMIPIWNVSSGFPRLVQDSSNKLDNQGRLDFIQEETKADESVANEPGEPIGHVVRNSMDEGLESVKEGKRRMKNPESSVRVSLDQEGHSIVTHIEDDERGPAVVAEEIHKLVEHTTKATNEMSSMVRQIQQDIRGIASSRDQVTNQVCQCAEEPNKTAAALSKIQVMANQMVVMIQQIAGAAVEQSNATQQIAGDLEVMTQTTQQTISGVAESAQSCHQLMALANDLQKTVSVFKE